MFIQTSDHNFSRKYLVFESFVVDQVIRYFSAFYRVCRLLLAILALLATSKDTHTSIITISIKFVNQNINNNMRLTNFLSELSLKSKTDIRRGTLTSQYWDVDIILTTGDKFELTFEKWGEKWDIIFTDESGSIETSTKGPKVALELFAAIEKVTTEFIKKVKPQYILFSSGAFEAKKQKLYNTLAQRISKKANYSIQSDPKSTGKILKRN